VAADPDEARLDRPGDRERPAIIGEQAIQHQRSGTDMGLIPPLDRQRHTIGGRPVLMQQQALHDT